MAASLLCPSLGATLPHLGLQARRSSALLPGYGKPRISKRRLPGKGLAALARRNRTSCNLTQAATPSTPKAASQQATQQTDAHLTPVTVVFEVPCRLGHGEALAIAGEAHALGGGGGESEALRLGWSPGNTPSADKWRSPSVKLNPGTLEFWVVKLLRNGEAEWGAKRTVVLPTLSPLMARCGCLIVTAPLGDSSPAASVQLVVEDRAQAQSLMCDASSRAQELSLRQLALQERVRALEGQVQESEGKLRHAHSLLQQRRKEAASAAAAPAAPPAVGTGAGASLPLPALELRDKKCMPLPQSRPVPHAPLQYVNLNKGRCPANSAVPSPGLTAHAAVHAAVPAVVLPTMVAAAAAFAAPAEPEGGVERLGVVRTSNGETLHWKGHWEGQQAQHGGGSIEGPTGPKATAQHSTAQRTMTQLSMAGGMAPRGSATGYGLPQVQSVAKAAEVTTGRADQGQCIAWSGNKNMGFEAEGEGEDDAGDEAATAAMLEATAAQVRAQLHYAGGLLERTVGGDGSIMYLFREGGCLALELAEVYCPNFLPPAAVAALQRRSFIAAPLPPNEEAEREGAEGGACLEDQEVEGLQAYARHGGVRAAAEAYIEEEAEAVEEREWEASPGGTLAPAAAAAEIPAEEEAEGEREWAAAAAEVRASLQAVGGLERQAATRDGGLLYCFRDGGCPASQLSDAYCAPFLPRAAAAALKRRGFLALPSPLPEPSHSLEIPLEGTKGFPSHSLEVPLEGTERGDVDAVIPVEGVVGVPIGGAVQERIVEVAGLGSMVGGSLTQGRAQGPVESKADRVDISNPSFPGLLMVAAAQQAWEAWRLLGLQALAIGGRVYASFAAAQAKRRLKVEAGPVPR